MISPLKRAFSLTTLATCVLACTQLAMAQMEKLAERLPPGATAVMTIDVAKLIQSPIGKKLELQSKLVSGYADRPLAVPGSAKAVAVGAAVHPTGMQSIWQAAVIELPSTPRLEPMLQAQGGFLDQIDGRKVAWTPRDIFYIQLDDNTLGVLRPAQRQFAKHWISSPSGKVLTPYLFGAVSGGGDAASVFAVDLNGAVGVAALRYALSMGQFQSLEQIQEGQDKLIAALTSVKGMKINVRATDKLEAQWLIDFDADVSALGSQVKPFIADALTAADLYEADAEQWDFKVSGKQIVGTGTMSPEGLNRLLMLLSPGDAAPATTIAQVAPDGARPAGESTSARNPAEASRQYYRAVAKILDGVSPKPSPRQSATWLVTQSRLIRQLPVLDVDPALIEWGNSVADTFVRVGQELAMGQQRGQVASLGVQSPTAFTTSTDHSEGSSTDSPETRAAFRNAQQQRRQVAQQERTVAAERAFAVFNDVLSTRGRIRAEMTQKYGIEF
jgi:hypothetical protein